MSDLPAALAKKLEDLVNQDDIMLFMKGDRILPRCGFSSKVVEILKEMDVNFSTFDILEDQEVRQGLKQFSQWPTYPQLYYKGELIGGSDIVFKMYMEGDLEDLLITQ